MRGCGWGESPKQCRDKQKERESLMSSKTSLTDADEAYARELFGRIGMRVVPVLLAAFVISYIDRVNVGFAAITASKDLGMSSADFGFGAGLFFISYMIFEAPSNYLLERIGARIWLARIMICCGIVSAAMFFVSNKTQFNIARFTLGVVEAGLFPGVVLYLTFWLHQHVRARHSALKRDWFTDFRLAAQHGRHPRLQGLAVALHHRSLAGLCGGHTDLGIAGRQTREGQLADSGRARIRQA
jgi:hypothetical protein